MCHIWPVPPAHAACRTDAGMLYVYQTIMYMCIFLIYIYIFMASAPLFESHCTFWLIAWRWRRVLFSQWIIRWVKHFLKNRVTHCGVLVTGVTGVTGAEPFVLTHVVKLKIGSHHKKFLLLQWHYNASRAWRQPSLSFFAFFSGGIRRRMLAKSQRKRRNRFIKRLHHWVVQLDFAVTTVVPPGAQH